MISVIVCSISEAKFAAVSAHYRQLLAGEAVEIIGIHDAKSLCEGYNRGVRQSTGEIVIFSHDDVEILSADFAARIHGHLQRYDLLGIAGTTRLVGPRWVGAGPPHVYGQVVEPDAPTGRYTVSIWSVPSRANGQMQALDGVFLCMTRRVVNAVAFDEESFRGFHLYDLDFTFRAYLAGFKLAVCGDIALVHASSGDFADPNWEQEGRVFVAKHRGRLGTAKLRSWCATIVDVGSKGEALEVMTPPHWGVRQD